MTKPITILDAPCGAGKSYTLHQKINELICNGEEVLVSVPSIKLAEQYERDLNEKYPDLPIEVIHSDNVEGDEKAVIVISKRMKEQSSPRATIITQTAFNILENRPFYHHGTKIKIVDEIPVPFKTIRYNDPEGIKRILPLIDAIPNDKNDGYYTLQCKSIVTLNKIASERDEMGDVPPLQELVYQILSNNYLNVVFKKHWDEHQLESIDLYCLMNNNIYKHFKDVIIAGGVEIALDRGPVELAKTLIRPFGPPSPRGRRGARRRRFARLPRGEGLG